MSFSFGSPNYFNDADWANTDTSQFLWDSPQPENQSLPNTSRGDPEDTSLDQDSFADTDASTANVSQGGSNATTLPHRTAPQTHFSTRSNMSETSSHSSSSDSSARRKRKTSTTSPPPFSEGAGSLALDEQMAPNDLRMDKMFDGNDDTFQYDDSAFPSMGQDMNNLSLNAIASTGDAAFGWNSTGDSPGLFADHPQTYSTQTFPSSMRTTQQAGSSPQMTVQPSKTFFFGDSSGDSPESLSMMLSSESSPSAPIFNNSPVQAASGAPSHAYSNSSSKAALLESSPLNFGASSASISKEPSPATNMNAKPYLAWPCHLEIDPMPEKSRVETQIPIKLTLHNAPRGTLKLHLPPHTISKPKFQAKPMFEKSSDTLELSAMLVCASAMEKPGVEEAAFKRAAADDIYVESEENQPASMKMHTDENNPAKPLNGGPVAICSGCIARERKRAARKKTKKAEEEEEWLKDEAKRVIVFNCPEVRDWCVPGTKETTVKEHDMPLDTIFVNAPMRIACYCRHQSEKIGFRVLFTIRTSTGAILAQAITQSIMITDDHKQPTSNSQNNNNTYPNPQMGTNAVLQSGNGFGLHAGAYPQPMPFRNSFSTNDLRQLGNQYAPQRRPQTLSRGNSNYSQNQSTITTNTTATPRNLSRPASPTNESGPTKKRRSGGGSGHKKMPSGLTMTRMGDFGSSAAAGNVSAGPTSAGPMATGFSFSPSQPSGKFGSGYDAYQSPAATSNPFKSGPSTPLHAPTMPTFATSFDADAFFYSAPTSQHASRAPSPSSGARSGFTPFGNNSQQVTDEASILAMLPPGFNLNRPPLIQRVIPTMGPMSGGDDVTILGTGFFQGLEVMFGDHMAPSTTYWGETTLVCRSPPALQPGMVQVVFKHQHHSSGTSQIRGILPTQPVYFEYFDDDRAQLQMLTVGASQGPGTDMTQISQEELSRAFLNASGGFSNFPSGGGGTGGNQQQLLVTAFDISRATDTEFERLLLAWLENMDMSPSPYSPKYNKKTRKGATLISLAAGRGYHRFCAGLLARGANPNSRDCNGFTPLMVASMRGHFQTMWLLTIKGADPTLRTLSGSIAADLVTSPQISNLFLNMSLASPARIVDREILRRPSSTPSLDSLSGYSSPSQTSNDNEIWDHEQKLHLPWNKGSSAEKQIRTGNQVYPEYQATAALSALRELMASQILHFQQTVQNTWSLPNFYQQYYEQYPMVRRISHFLSHHSMSLEFTTNSTNPPAYEDIFPTSGARQEVAGTFEAGKTPTQYTSNTRDVHKGLFLSEDTKGELPAVQVHHPGMSEEVSTKKHYKIDCVPLVSFEFGAFSPWVLLLIGVIFGVWNYSQPVTCTRTAASLTRIRAIIEGLYAA